MSKRLDNRTSLYGEPRLSDPQVIALRGAALGKLHRSAQGWFVDGHQAVAAGTLAFLERHLLIEIVARSTRGSAVITGRGNKLLAMIDEAA